MREVRTYLIIVCLFTAGDLDGSRTKIFPDKGMLLRFEKSSDQAALSNLEPNICFGILAEEMFDDCHEGFSTNLVLKHTQVTVGLWGRGYQNTNIYQNNHCIICVQMVLEGRVDKIKLMLVDQETRVAPWRFAREGELHDVADEHVVKVGLDAVW